MNIKDILLEVLKWVGESPLRLFILFMVSLMVLGFWFVYTEKDAFMASYRAQQSLPKMNGKYEDAVNFLMKRGDADLVAIYEVNPILNTRKLVYMMVKSEGHIKTYNGLDVGLFTKNIANNNDVINLMSGAIPCSEYKKPQSFIGFIYLEKGITFACRISVPPDPSKFIGQITVGWKEQPADIDVIKIIIHIAAEMLFDSK